MRWGAISAVEMEGGGSLDQSYSHLDGKNRTESRYILEVGLINLEIEEW